MTLRAAPVGLSSLLIVSGCSLIVSTSGLHGDVPADAGEVDASAGGGSDGDTTADAGVDSPALATGCPNAAGLADSAWPMAGGCPTHMGRSKLVGPKTAGDRVLRTVATSAFAGPIFASDGTIYFGSEEPNGLVALSPDGGVKWTGDTAGNVSAMAAVAADGSIYVGASGSIVGLRPDGSRKFKVPAADEQDMAPAIAPDGTVYTGGFDSKLYAIAPDGTQRWAYVLDDDPAFSHPAIGVDGTIYVGSRDLGLHAVTPEGTRKWRFATGGITWAPTIGADGTIYAGTEGGSLFAVNADGTLRWVFPAGSPVKSMPALMEDGTIVVGTDAGELLAVRPDGTKRWGYDAGKPITESDPVIDADGTIYVGAGAPGAAGDLHAISADGARIFVQPLSGRPYRQPAIGPDGRLYVTVNATGKGELHAIGP